MKITKDMKIAEVMRNYPSSRTVLKKYLHACTRCGGASAESIERGARMHGVDPDTLVAELNRAITPRKKK
jgi:hybrid cluster-associated redox disulfide protein